MTETERIVEKLNKGVFPQVSELEYILGDIPAEEEEWRAPPPQAFRRL